ncbi:TIGR02450 family Trp-rich protein [Neptuniibacter caesariensis]|uniref:TIGR02450 family Trp-rich protein n=1 Tax=Neptuniibacter caesariensis TaxID=207954 RepID=A0A7U8GRU7_NEPCE|nr:TIGR02450 family Trp-rich protein [Neptuniibacter caesariensis]EAR60716.1 hypothetical protein MED92_13613 [Neptuniibacter caesariensis]
MNQINPRKLLLSKWTAVQPVKKRKHFLVTDLIVDDLNDEVIGCILEAVIDKESFEIQWQDLKNRSVWLQGWK